MMALFLSECKKVWKKKSNLIILMIFIGVTLFQGYDAYHRSVGNHLQEEYGEKDGYTGLEWNQIMDEELHAYASDAFGKEEYQIFIQDYKEAMRQLPQKQINEEKMIEKYGKEYQTFFERAKKGDVTQDEVNQFCIETNGGCDYAYEIEEGKGKYHFATFYENDLQRMYQNVKYANTVEEASFIKIEELPYHFGHVLAHKEEYLYPNGKYSKEFLYEGNLEKENEKDLVYALLNEKFKRQTTSFDSTIPNNIFMESLLGINVFTLVVIALLCATIFSQESLYKTDQIIVPTTYGSTKVVIAKCLCGLSIGASVVLLQWVCFIGFSFLYLPMRTLDISVMNMGGTWAYVKTFVYTYREVLVNGFFLTLIASLFTAVITMFLSFFTKHRIGTIVPVFLFLFVPLVFPVWELFACPPLQYVFPTTAMSFIEYFNGVDSYFVWQDHVIALKDVVMYGMLIVSVLLIGIVVWYDRKHIVKNH